MTNEIIESLNNCQVARAPLKNIAVMKWPRALKVLTCMSGTILKTRDELQDLAKKIDSEGILETQVEIGTIDLRWYMQESKNFFAFVRLLENLPIGFYSTDFIVLLIEQFFKDA